MDAQAMIDRCVKQFGIRIGPHTGTYLLNRLNASQAQDRIPVMGGDARTGIPVRTYVPLGQLAGAESSVSNPTA